MDNELKNFFKIQESDQEDLNNLNNQDKNDKLIKSKIINISDIGLKPGFTRKTFAIRKDYFKDLKTLAWHYRLPFYNFMDQVFTNFLMTAEHRSVLLKYKDKISNKKLQDKRKKD